MLNYVTSWWVCFLTDGKNFGNLSEGPSIHHSCKLWSKFVYWFHRRLSKCDFPTGYNVKLCYRVKNCQNPSNICYLQNQNASFYFLLLLRLKSCRIIRININITIISEFTVSFYDVKTIMD